MVWSWLEHDSPSCLNTAASVSVPVSAPPPTQVRKLICIVGFEQSQSLNPKSSKITFCTSSFYFWEEKVYVMCVGGEKKGRKAKMYDKMCSVLGIQILTISKFSKLATRKVLYFQAAWESFRGYLRGFVISLVNWICICVHSIAKGCHHQTHMPSTWYDIFYLFSG